MDAKVSIPVGIFLKIFEWFKFWIQLPSRFEELINTQGSRTYCDSCGKAMTIAKVEQRDEYWEKAFFQCADPMCIRHKEMRAFQVQKNTYPSPRVRMI